MARISDGDEHKGHRLRLKRRFIKEGSLDSFEPHEILEFLLYFAIPQGDTNPLAHRLIRRFGSLSAVLEASPEQLREVDGVGPHTASLLTFIKPLNDAVKRLEQEADWQVANIGDAERLACQMMEGVREERVLIMLLNASGRVTQVVNMAEGSAVSVEIPISKIMELVVRTRPASVILIHNHPGGSPQPSEDDRRATRRLILAMRFLEVQLADHIIVGETGSYSFKKEGGVDELMAEANIRAGQNLAPYEDETKP